MTPCITAFTFRVLVLAVLVFSAGWSPAVAASVQAEAVDGKSYDLVVVGATPGGIACAVRAAREGLTVLLVNHTQHLGGFVTSGAGGWEAPYDGLRSPIYAEIRNAATDHYRNTYGENSPQHLASLPSATSNSHLDRPKIEPRIAEMLFDQMVAGEKSLSVLKGFYVSNAEREGNLLKAVSLREMHGKGVCRVSALMFADGMYEGDLAAAAKVPCRVGREARSEYNEPHAGVIFSTEAKKEAGPHGFPKDAVEGRLKIRYNSHATNGLCPESTGEADGSVMAYNFRPILTKNPANRVMVSKPENYSVEVARKAANGGFVPNLPNDKVAWNGGRLIGPQDEYPAADWPTRERIAGQYRHAMLCALWYYQNDPAAPEKEREKWKDYGLAADEFPDNGNFPYEIYVREARRIVGRYVFTEHDGVPARGIGRTPIHADSVAMTDWPLDSVACTSRKVPGATLDGIFFLAEEARPSQVSYRTLLAQGIDNLLVPVALSATHVGWGCIRLEPVWMQTGEAAGCAAALAKKTRTTPAQLDPDVLLKTLVEHRDMVSFFNDVDVTSGEPWVAAVEYLGTKGFFNSYDARPSQPLSQATARCWLKTFAKLAARQSFDPTEEARQLPAEESGDIAPAAAAEFFAELKRVLRDAKGAAPDTLSFENKSTLTRAEACQVMYQLLR